MQQVKKNIRDQMIGRKEKKLSLMNRTPFYASTENIISETHSSLSGTDEIGSENECIGNFCETLMASNASTKKNPYMTNMVRVEDRKKAILNLSSGLNVRSPDTTPDTPDPDPNAPGDPERQDNPESTTVTTRDGRPVRPPSRYSP
ncbi:unnamed protein product [Larinioides sclopetarius]|uniref:Uncharacterized protein n=1 Tax=Larinioides sclopetarius TaxID=280406 RepID=A0AAV2B5A3_9ARAC